MHMPLPPLVATLATLLLSTLTIWAEPGSSFQLKGVRSTHLHGPFQFQSGTMLKLESGFFQLNLLPGGRSFTLTSRPDGLAYGVYELVEGRIIEAGNQLYTILNIRTPIASPEQASPPPASRNRGYTTPTPSAQGHWYEGITLTIIADLFEDTDYEWTINNRSGSDSQTIQRQGATLLFQKGIMNARLGLTASSEWDHTIKGDGIRFENATLKEGTGWHIGTGIDWTIFEDKGWTATLGGDIIFRQDQMTLAYGAWEVVSTQTTVQTNTTGSNAVVTTTNIRYNRKENDVTLSETMLTLDARLDYETDIWLVYGGIRVFAWDDVSMDAEIVADDTIYPIEFERKDPLTAYLGTGLFLDPVRIYGEFEAGAIMALRAGISMSF